MNIFEDDGKDNHETIARMLQTINDYEDAYMELSEPLQAWMDRNMRIAPNVPLCVSIFRLADATQAMAELMGVEELPEYWGEQPQQSEQTDQEAK